MIHIYCYRCTIKSPSSSRIGVRSLTLKPLTSLSNILFGFTPDVCLRDVVCFLFWSTENHRTQTEYDDALIIKLFAFQFCNSYTSLYYIAFFRGLVRTSPVTSHSLNTPIRVRLFMQSFSGARTVIVIGHVLGL